MQKTEETPSCCSQRGILLAFYAAVPSNVPGFIYERADSCSMHVHAWIAWRLVALLGRQNILPPKLQAHRLHDTASAAVAGSCSLEGNQR